MMEFFKRKSTVAWLAFTAFFAACMAGVFWGTWSLGLAPIEPDHAVAYPADFLARHFGSFLRGAAFVPFDLRYLLGGPYFWQELQYAFALYMGAMAMAYYLRGRGVSLFARYAAAAAYGLMGYSVTLFSAGHMGWFEILVCGPFAFGLVDRAVRKGKWSRWAILGAVLAWASVHQPDIWYLLTLLVFAYGVFKVARWLLACRRDPVGGRAVAREIVRMAEGVAVCAAAAFLVGWPQFRGGIDAAKEGRSNQIAETMGEARRDDPAARYEFCTNWSLPPEDTLEFLVPGVHGDSSDPRVSPKTPYVGRLGMKRPDGKWVGYRQHSLYLGFGTILFALAAIVLLFVKPRPLPSAAAPLPCRCNRAEVLFWIGAAMVVYLFALGCFTPFYRIFYALPAGSIIRCPVKFVHLLEWCVAALAGFGIDGLMRLGASSFSRRFIASAVVAVAVANAISLARADSAYCATDMGDTLKIAMARNPNPAADDIAKAGGGALFVMVPPQEGGQVFKEGIGGHGTYVMESPDETRPRFLFVSGRTFAADKTLGERLKDGRLKMIGSYAISATKGIFRASGREAGYAVLMDPSVPAVARPQPREEGSFVFVLVSALASFALLGWVGVESALRLRRA